MPTPAEAAAAARYLLALRDAQENFLSFVRLLYPTWDIPAFHVDLATKLNAFERDELGVDNLLITMPPRHSKSTYSTVLFPAYYMARDPRRFVMSCSYNAQLAEGFGREIRNIVEDKKIVQAFPDFTLHGKSTAVDSWRTEAGGIYNAVGIGGTTSGRPANLLIVDDPIKAREDAESMTQRNKTWSYYTSALTTRLQPTHNNRPPKQIIILTRWHPDDLAGRLQETEDWQEGRWEHINYRAITERTIYLPVTPSKRKGDKSAAPTTKTEEVALWPERFPLEELKRRQRISPHDFQALYQQEPTILGGNVIKSSWWRTYDQANAMPGTPTGPALQTLIIGVDTAFKKKETADYSVALIAGMDHAGDIYLLDLIRRRMDYPELKQQLVTLNQRWRGKGLRAFYIEDKASGMSVIQDLRRQTGMAVIPYSVKGDKVARVQSVLPLIEGGRVHIPESAPWLDAFIEETQAFPNGKNDDQVDALSMTLDILSRTAIGPDVMAMHVDPGHSLNSLLNRERQQFPGQADPTMRRNADAFGKSLTAALKSSKWNGWGL